MPTTNQEPRFQDPPPIPSPLSATELEKLAGPIRQHIEQLHRSNDWLLRRIDILDRECSTTDAKLCIAAVYLTSDYFHRQDEHMRKRHGDVLLEALLYS